MDPTQAFIKALEDELTAFPNGAHDDLVDALVYAWRGAVGAQSPAFGTFNAPGL